MFMFPQNRKTETDKFLQDVSEIRYGLTGISVLGITITLRSILPRYIDGIMIADFSRQLVTDFPVKSVDGRRGKVTGDTSQGPTEDNPVVVTGRGFRNCRIQLSLSQPGESVVSCHQESAMFLVGEISAVRVEIPQEDTTFRVALLDCKLVGSRKLVQLRYNIVRIDVGSQHGEVREV